MDEHPDVITFEDEEELLTEACEDYDSDVIVLSDDDDEDCSELLCDNLLKEDFDNFVSDEVISDDFLVKVNNVKENDSSNCNGQSSLVLSTHPLNRIERTSIVAKDPQKLNDSSIPCYEEFESLYNNPTDGVVHRMKAVDTDISEISSCKKDSVGSSSIKKTLSEMSVKSTDSSDLNIQNENSLLQATTSVKNNLENTNTSSPSLVCADNLFTESLASQMSSTKCSTTQDSEKHDSNIMAVNSKEAKISKNKSVFCTALKSRTTSLEANNVHKTKLHNNTTCFELEDNITSFDTVVENIDPKTIFNNENFEKAYLVKNVQGSETELEKRIAGSETILKEFGEGSETVKRVSSISFNTSEMHVKDGCKDTELDLLRPENSIKSKTCLQLNANTESASKENMKKGKAKLKIILNKITVEPKTMLEKKMKHLKKYNVAEMNTTGTATLLNWCSSDAKSTLMNETACSSSALEKNTTDSNKTLLTCTDQKTIVGIKSVDSETKLETMCFKTVLDTKAEGKNRKITDLRESKEGTNSLLKKNIEEFESVKEQGMFQSDILMNRNTSDISENKSELNKNKIRENSSKNSLKILKKKLKTKNNLEQRNVMEKRYPPSRNKAQLGFVSEKSIIYPKIVLNRCTSNSDILLENNSDLFKDTEDKNTAKKKVKFICNPKELRSIVTIVKNIVRTKGLEPIVKNKKVLQIQKRKVSHNILPRKSIAISGSSLGFAESAYADGKHRSAELNDSSANYFEKTDELSEEKLLTKTSLNPKKITRNRVRMDDYEIAKPHTRHKESNLKNKYKITVIFVEKVKEITEIIKEPLRTFVDESSQNTYAMSDELGEEISATPVMSEAKAVKSTESSLPNQSSRLNQIDLNELTSSEVTNTNSKGSENITHQNRLSVAPVTVRSNNILKQKDSLNKNSLIFRGKWSKNKIDFKTRKMKKNLGNSALKKVGNKLVYIEKRKRKAAFIEKQRKIMLRSRKNILKDNVCIPESNAESSTSGSFVKNMEDINIKEKKNVEDINIKEKKNVEDINIKEKKNVEDINIKEKKNVEDINIKEKKSMEDINIKEKKNVEGINIKEKKNVEGINIKEKKNVEDINIKQKRFSASKNSKNVEKSTNQNVKKKKDKNQIMSNDLENAKNVKDLANQIVIKKSRNKIISDDLDNTENVEEATDENSKSKVSEHVIFNNSVNTEISLEIRDQSASNNLAQTENENMTDHDDKKIMDQISNNELKNSEITEVTSVQNVRQICENQSNSNDLKNAENTEAVQSVHQKFKAQTMSNVLKNTINANLDLNKEDKICHGNFTEDYQISNYKSDNALPSNTELATCDKNNLQNQSMQNHNVSLKINIQKQEITQSNKVFENSGACIDSVENSVNVIANSCDSDLLAKKSEEDLRNRTTVRQEKEPENILSNGSSNVKGKDTKKTIVDTVTENVQRLKRRSLKLGTHLKQEVQCCGHWFPSRKNFIQHLIENSKNEVKSLHTAKLIDLDMHKCTMCSMWLSNINIKRHIKLHHNVSNNRSAKSLTDKSVECKSMYDTPESLSVPQTSTLVSKDGHLLEEIQTPCPKSKKKYYVEYVKCDIGTDSDIFISCVEDVPRYLKPSLILHRCKGCLRKKVVRKKKKLRYVDLLNEGAGDTGKAFINNKDNPKGGDLPIYVKEIVKSGNLKKFDEVPCFSDSLENVELCSASNLPDDQSKALITKEKNEDQVMKSQVQKKFKKPPASLESKDDTLEDNLISNKIQKKFEVSPQIHQDDSLKTNAVTKNKMLKKSNLALTLLKVDQKNIVDSDFVKKKVNKKFKKKFSAFLDSKENNPVIKKEHPKKIVQNKKALASQKLSKVVTVTKPVGIAEVKIITNKSGYSETPVKCKEPLKARRLSVDSNVRKHSVKYKNNKNIRNSIENYNEGGAARNIKRCRRGRGRGRMRRKVGFHSSDSSEGSSDESDSSSSSNFENEISSKEDLQENEIIPTVELNLFTLSSLNEDMSILLVDPNNPNFKVMASMDAIFVGDSALSDLTNQMSYVSCDTNVVYISPNHFLFPDISDSEDIPSAGKISGNTRRKLRSKAVLIKAVNKKSRKNVVNDDSQIENNKENAGRSIENKISTSKGVSGKETMKIKLKVHREVPLQVNSFVDSQLINIEKTSHNAPKDSYKSKKGTVIPKEVDLDSEKNIKKIKEVGKCFDYGKKSTVKTKEIVGFDSKKKKPEVNNDNESKIESKMDIEGDLDKIDMEGDLDKIDVEDDLDRNITKIKKDEKDNLDGVNNVEKTKKVDTIQNNSIDLETFESLETTISSAEKTQKDIVKIYAHSETKGESIQKAKEENSKINYNRDIIVIKTSTGRGNLEKSDYLQSIKNNKTVLTISTKSKTPLINSIPLETSCVRTPPYLEQKSISNILSDSTDTNKNDIEEFLFKSLSPNKNDVEEFPYKSLSPNKNDMEEFLYKSLSPNNNDMEEFSYKSLSSNKSPVFPKSFFQSPDSNMLNKCKSSNKVIEDAIISNIKDHQKVTSFPSIPSHSGSNIASTSSTSLSSGSNFSNIASTSSTTFSSGSNFSNITSTTSLSSPFKDAAPILKQCFTPVKISTDSQVVVATAKIVPSQEEIEDGVCLEEMLDEDLEALLMSGDDGLGHNICKGSEKDQKNSEKDQRINRHSISSEDLNSFLDFNSDISDILETALLSSDVLDKSKHNEFSELNSEHKKTNEKLLNTPNITDISPLSFSLKSSQISPENIHPLSSMLSSQVSPHNNSNYSISSTSPSNHESPIPDIVDITSGADTSDSSDVEICESSYSGSPPKPFDFKAVVQGKNLWNTPLICLSSPDSSPVRNSNVMPKFEQKSPYGNPALENMNLLTSESNEQSFLCSTEKDSLLSSVSPEKDTSKSFISPKKDTLNQFVSIEKETLKSSVYREKGTKKLFISPEKNIRKQSVSPEKNTSKPSISPKMVISKPSVDLQKSGSNLTLNKPVSSKLSLKTPLKANATVTPSKSSCSVNKTPSKFLESTISSSSKASKSIRKTTFKSSKSIKKIPFNLKDPLTTPKKIPKINKTDHQDLLALKVSNENLSITPEKRKQKCNDIQRRVPSAEKSKSSDNFYENEFKPLLESDNYKEKSVPLVSHLSSESLKMRICVKDFSKDVLLREEHGHKHKKKKKHSRKKRERKLEKLKNKNSQSEIIPQSNFQIKTENEIDNPRDLNSVGTSNTENRIDNPRDVDSFGTPNSFIKVEVPDDLSLVECKKEIEKIYDTDLSADDISKSECVDSTTFPKATKPLVVKHFDSVVTNSSDNLNVNKNANILDPKNLEPMKVQEIDKLSSGDSNKLPEKGSYTVHKPSKSVRDDRSWHSRGSKLKAKVMITDQQMGITNSFVGDDLKPANASVSNPPSSKSRKNIDPIKTKDIRNYFTPKKPSDQSSVLEFPLVSPANESSLPSLTDFNSRPFFTPEGVQETSSLSNPKHGSVTIARIPKKEKRKHSQHVDIRQYFSGTTLSETDSDMVSLPKKTRLEIKKEKDEVEEDFEGFEDSFNNYSYRRSRLLQEYVDVLHTNTWFESSRYPVPVDQLCDWDDSQLNIALFEKG